MATIFVKPIYALNRIERKSEPSGVDLQNYLLAILTVEQNVIDLDPDAARSLQLGLRSLHRELTADAEPETIAASQATFATLLVDYREAVLKHHNQKESDVREILSVLGSAAETLGTQNEKHNVRLKGFTQQLQVVSRGQDLSEIRRALTKQVIELGLTAEAIRRDSQNSATYLQSQLSQFQERLERAERLASTDELTSLLNRREGEAQLAEHIAKNSPFSLLVLDLDRFKMINDENGHNAGDQVLKLFAKRLAKLVRPSDVVCRWGGDEFVVLMDIPLSSARERAVRIRAELSDNYAVILIGKATQLPVRASIGVAEFSPGDDAEHLFARADEDLYRQKKTATLLVLGKECAG